MSKPLRWGILGTGNIASQFAAGVAGARRSVITAVGSREASTAGTFAQRYAIANVHGTYDSLLSDPNVDAIYLSLPNSMHHNWTLRALAAGKHVLCEKPFATNAAEAQEMFDAARRRGLVLVEAFMYMSQPQTLAVLDEIRSGAIGEVRLVRTSFCYRTLKVDTNIRFRKDLAGGAMMDVGCYCLSFSRLMIGKEPTSVHAVGKIHHSGVDEMAAGVLGFEGGAAATFSCGMSVQADNTAYICGTEGYIEIPVPWKPPATGATYTIARSTPPKMDAVPGAAPAAPPRVTKTADAGGPLYAVEADDFAAAVLDGAPPRVSEAHTMGNMHLLDTIRRQIGLQV